MTMTDANTGTAPSTGETNAAFDSLTKGLTPDNVGALPSVDLHPAEPAPTPATADLGAISDAEPNPADMHGLRVVAAEPAPTPETVAAQVAAALPEHATAEKEGEYPEYKEMTKAERQAALVDVTNRAVALWELLGGTPPADQAEEVPAAVEPTPAVEPAAEASSFVTEPVQVGPHPGSPAEPAAEATVLPRTQAYAAAPIGEAAWQPGPADKPVFPVGPAEIPRDPSARPVRIDAPQAAPQTEAPVEQPADAALTPATTPEAAPATGEA